MDELLERFHAFGMRPDTRPVILDDIKYSTERDKKSAPQSRNIKKLPADPNVEETPVFEDNDLSDTARRARFFESVNVDPSKLRFPPLDILPCANVQVNKYSACTRPGTMACSDCRLVSYCSKECQKVHWKEHKADCRNIIRSDLWMPAWSREGRPPLFVNESTPNLEEEFRQRKTEEFSVGMALWGNTPAMDIINLENNEKSATKDFNLAFIASGDLRHILSTVNRLPATYSGNLSILVNDINRTIVCRNIVLLLILGTIPDESLAADIALHFWYSVFMPVEYQMQISGVIIKFVERIQGEGKISIPLGPNSTLTCCLDKGGWMFLRHFISFSLTMDEAQVEYDRVRNAHSRRDYRDRMYARLKPSHRAAFQQYRRFGIVLPFGAISAHFNCPNQSLFSSEGIWLQTDYADPLGGWDPIAVIEAGKAHGAQSEDIYGCLYFFLSKELRTFAHRVRDFKTTFNVFTFDTGHVLPMAIRDGDLSDFGAPGSILFDRIATSNILDVDYVGLKDVLVNWSPLLAHSPNAAIVGYFMNWVAVQEGGRAVTSGPTITRKLIPELMEKTMKQGRLPHTRSSPLDIIYLLADDIEALYDNSEQFTKYLKKQGLIKILQTSKLEMRVKHTIVPHRIFTPIRGLPEALPAFANDESWYNKTKLNSSSWSERYVEFVHL